MVAEKDEANYQVYNVGTGVITRVVDFVTPYVPSIIRGRRVITSSGVTIGENGVVSVGSLVAKNCQILL